MRERRALLALFFCALAGAGHGLAAPAGTAATAPSLSPSLRDVAVLVDVVGTETVESVAAAPPGRWRPVPGILSAGFTRSVHWMRFTVDAPSGEWWLEVLPPFLDDLRGIGSLIFGGSGGSAVEGQGVVRKAWGGRRRGGAAPPQVS